MEQTNYRINPKISKMDLGVLLTKWLTADSLPFSTVETMGFQEFLLKTGVVSNIKEIPSESYLRKQILPDCHDYAKEQLLKEISKVEFASVQTDIWSDNFSRASYMTVILNYIDEEWVKQKANLKTAVMKESHTGKYIAEIMMQILDDYGLKCDNLVGVSDRGANVLKAFSTLKMRHNSCLGHAIHNLITVDGFKPLRNLKNILNKLGKVSKALQYKKQFLIAKVKNEKQLATIEEILDNGIVQ